MRHIGLAWIVTLFWSTVVLAQSADDIVFVQVEAHPSRTIALDRARLYSNDLEDVNGFSLSSGWFGIALGPYRRADALQVLQVYLSERAIPRDSYLALTDAYGQQFFPPGADVLSRGALPVTAAPETTATAEPEPPEPADETPAEARRSERALTAQERKDLQIALKWAGFYTSAIDGAFGRGTRSSMAAWQEANNYDVTGILTTQQRVALFQQYNAVLDGLDLKLVQEAEAGVEMQIPLGAVAFDSYDYPFAKYAPTGEIPAQVLMISQAGDQTTLFGLYDIMQTLEIVPLDGTRERRSNSFLLVGENDKIVSHTEAELRNGQIKGFTLVWPAGDEERRTRVLDEMRGSFARLDGVLDPSFTDADVQAVDLVAGLQVRKPRLSRSGFFVSNDGVVLTTPEAVNSCTRVTLDEETTARIALVDDTLGLAVLTPDESISPRAVGQFARVIPRLQSDVAVSGFSFGGVLGESTMTFGTVSDLRGLQGEEMLTRLELDTLDGDAGGPVFDQSGAIMGMLLPQAETGRQLPMNVQFSVDALAIQTVLDRAGVRSFTRNGTDLMPPEDITTQARDMTVLVSCWD